MGYHMYPSENKEDIKKPIKKKIIMIMIRQQLAVSFLECPQKLRSSTRNLRERF